MIQVRIATITIRANRIVYADGSVNRLFFSGSTGDATADSLTDASRRSGFVRAHLVIQREWRDPLRSVRSLRESYCPLSGEEDNRSDGTQASPAYAGAGDQE